MVIFLFPSMISLCAQKSWNSLEAFIFEIRENHYLDGAKGIPCFSLHVSIGISELEFELELEFIGNELVYELPRACFFVQRAIRIRDSMEEDE